MMCPERGAVHFAGERDIPVQSLSDTPGLGEKIAEIPVIENEIAELEKTPQKKEDAVDEGEVPENAAFHGPGR